MNAKQLVVPSGAQSLGTLIRAEVLAFIRTSRSLIWTVAVPVLILVLGNQGPQTGQPEVFARCAVALVTGTFALGLMGYSTVLANYRERGLFQLLRCTPAPASQLLAARLVVQLLAVVTEGVVVLVGARLLYRVLPDPTAIGLTFAVLLVVGLSALALGQLVAALTRTASSATSVARVLLIALLVLGGAVGGKQAWSGALQGLTAWSPVQLSQQLLVSSMISGRLAAAGWGQLGMLLAWVVAMGFVGVRWFRWDYEQ